MIKSKISFPYNEGEIVKIVQMLYSKKKKYIANEICNRYGEEGFYFLRELYEKNNKTNKNN